MPRLHGRPLNAELLTVHAAVQRVEIERVMRKNRERGDTIADPVIGCLQRCLAQILLVSGFQRVRRLRFSGQVDKLRLAGRERSQRWA